MSMYSYEVWTWVISICSLVISIAALAVSLARSRSAGAHRGEDL